MSDSGPAVEVIPPGDPRAVAVAARLHPEAFKLVREPFSAFEIPDLFGDLFAEPRPRPRVVRRRARRS